VPTGNQIKKPHPKIPSFSPLILFFLLKKIGAALLDITTSSYGSAFTSERHSSNG
jgi:hypothetical protein